MGTSKILAEDTVAVSELRKNPSDYFLDRPVAVMSHNKATGYTLGAELFEKLMHIVELSQQKQSVEGLFRPSIARMNEITQASADFLSKAKEDDLGKFSE